MNRRAERDLGGWMSRRLADYGSDVKPCGGFSDTEGMKLYKMPKNNAFPHGNLWKILCIRVLHFENTSCIILQVIRNRAIAKR